MIGNNHQSNHHRCNNLLDKTYGFKWTSCFDCPVNSRAMCCQNLAFQVAHTVFLFQLLNCRLTCVLLSPCSCMIFLSSSTAAMWRLEFLAYFISSKCLTRAFLAAKVIRFLVGASVILPFPCVSVFGLIVLFQKTKVCSHGREKVALWGA